mmetsp:Transcript_15553/g.48140  ORF Transcript_15553/g.48140 Transcript_15553/m.48140 type:complete len:216 (+) Transcript_15553:220-867(+)
MAAILERADPGVPAPAWPRRDGGTYDVRPDPSADKPDRASPPRPPAASSPGGGMPSAAPSTPYFCWSLRHICFFANSFIDAFAALACASSAPPSASSVTRSSLCATMVTFASSVHVLASPNLLPLSRATRAATALASRVSTVLTKISFVVLIFWSAAFLVHSTTVFMPRAFTSVSVRAGRASSSSSSSPQAIFLVACARAPIRNARATAQALARH